MCTKRPIGTGVLESTYRRGLYKSLTKAGVDVKNWYELALDKSKWRKIIYDISFWFTFILTYFIYMYM